MVDDGTGTLVSQAVTTPDQARNKVFVITLFFYQRDKVEAQCTLEPMTDEVELVYGSQKDPLKLTPPSQSFTYSGTAQTYSSAVTVKDGATTLTAGTDYDLHYSNNINAGVGTVAAVGKGTTYAGRVGTYSFNISKAVGDGTIAFAEDDVSKAYGDDDFTNTLTPSLSGAGTISYHIAYTSNHPEIATVGSDGTVHIVSAAPATPVTITATVQDGANHHYASTIQDTYTLTVERKLGELSYATTAVEKTYSTDPFTNPLTLTGDAIPIYNSSEPTVATVDTDGAVTLLKAGTTTISASVAGGIGINYQYSPASTSYTLQVNKAPATISFAEPNITKRVGDPKFIPVVNNTGNNLTLSFESSDPAVASVNASTGEVTIVGTGITSIMVATADTDQYDYDPSTATLNLTVTK